MSGTCDMSERTLSGPRRVTEAGDTMTFSTVSTPLRRGDSISARTGTLRSMRLSALTTMRGGCTSMSSKARSCGPMCSPDRGTTVVPFLMPERLMAWVSVCCVMARNSSSGPRMRTCTLLMRPSVITRLGGTPL